MQVRLEKLILFVAIGLSLISPAINASNDKDIKTLFDRIASVESKVAVNDKSWKDIAVETSTSVTESLTKSTAQLADSLQKASVSFPTTFNVQHHYEKPEVTFTISRDVVKRGAQLTGIIGGGYLLIRGIIDMVKAKTYKIDASSTATSSSKTIKQKPNLPVAITKSILGAVTLMASILWFKKS